MRRLRLTIVLVALTITSALAQSPPGPTFDVVSIKRNTSNSLGNSMRQAPDGGFTMVNSSVQFLIASAYPTSGASEVVGLPAWATSERYDVMATAALPASPSADDRREMMRAMLADRFKLKAHYEKREQPAFALVVARGDGKLGPQLKPAEVDCEARFAAQRAEAEAARGGTPPERSVPVLPAPGSPVPPCTTRMTGNRMEGDMTMATLARFLRPAAGRYIVDKTGLTGYYRVVLEYARMAGLRGPDVASTPGEAPSVFTAVQEQLGLKLESTRTELDMLVIDSIERPSEN